ncbi:hypothetical protein [Lysobacter soyae]|uniref:Protein sip-5 n=1 Tax=Lysobacter soyae TaxID=2764185 RepID=A0ABX8WPS4_9GAMM|nr:hypothetical protein [Lysobacter sp. CJ11]QYR52834.1 hypothetical protein H8L67_09720 [Lysobacter sp. CJ11]
MGFSHLKEKVDQAEKALEANERVVASDWRVFKQSWRDAWTPGRIIVAGLASGYVFGRIEPVSKSKASSIVNMLTAVGGLFASGTAKGAAIDAKNAANRVEQNVPAGAGEFPAQVAPVADDALKAETHEKLRKAGLI